MKIERPYRFNSRLNLLNSGDFQLDFSFDGIIDENSIAFLKTMTDIWEELYKGNIKLGLEGQVNGEDNKSG